MRATITSITFDFTDDDGELSAEEQQKIISSVIGKVYEVDDESEIADAISDETGWLVSALDYDLSEEQGSYRFYVDQKCTIWYRNYFSIMADSQEHANELAKKLFADEGLHSIEQKLESMSETEQLWDTVEPIGEEELFSADGDLIASIGS